MAKASNCRSRCASSDRPCPFILSAETIRNRAMGGSLSQMEYDTTLADRAYSLASSWHSSRSLSSAELAQKFSSADLHGWSATQIVLFLETLGTQDVYGKETVEAFEGIYGFNANANPEIKVRRAAILVGRPRTHETEEVHPLYAHSSVGSCSRSRRACTPPKLPTGSATRAV